MARVSKGVLDWTPADFAAAERAVMDFVEQFKASKTPFRKETRPSDYELDIRDYEDERGATRRSWENF